MEATPPPVPSDPPTAAPPAFVPAAPAAVSDRMRVPLAFALGALLMILAFAGYRLYEKDRAETAAELVRIRAYLEVRAQAESAPEKKRAKPPSAERVAAAAPVPARPEPDAAARVPRAAKAGPVAADRRPKPAEARPKTAEVRPKPPVEARAKMAEVRAKPPKPDPVREEAPVRTAERPKSVDRLWRERTARECAPGFVGLICREWLKFELCREHEAWGKAAICPVAERPPPSVMSGSLG